LHSPETNPGAPAGKQPVQAFTPHASKMQAAKASPSKTAPRGKWETVKVVEGLEDLASMPHVPASDVERKQAAPNVLAPPAVDVAYATVSSSQSVTSTSWLSFGHF